MHVVFRGCTHVVSVNIKPQKLHVPLEASCTTSTQDIELLLRGFFPNFVRPRLDDGMFLLDNYPAQPGDLSDFGLIHEHVEVRLPGFKHIEAGSAQDEIRMCTRIHPTSAVTHS